MEKQVRFEEKAEQDDLKQEEQTDRADSQQQEAEYNRQLNALLERDDASYDEFLQLAERARRWKQAGGEHFVAEQQDKVEELHEAHGARLDHEV